MFICLAWVSANASKMLLVPTKGRPQYVHMHTCGLSVLINILGCPRGPPPPSQATTLSCTHLTGCLWMSSIAAYGRGYRASQDLIEHISVYTRTCSSMIVCSNLGPDIATSLGCWLRDQTPRRLGACATLISSPFSADSTNLPSAAPCFITGTSFVFDTLGTSFAGVGSLACILFSEARRGVEVERGRIVELVTLRAARAAHILTADIIPELLRK